MRLPLLDHIKDFQSVQNIIMDGVDYSMIVNGESPTKKDVNNFFAAIAPGKSSNEMLKLGIEKDHQLIGLVDLAKNFPLERVWHIGLLLLHTSYRNKGVGRYVVDEIETMARSAQVLKLRIGVVEENAAAIAFWQRVGFREISRIPDQSFGIKRHTVIELERDIPE